MGICGSLRTVWRKQLHIKINGCIGMEEIWAGVGWAMSLSSQRSHRPLWHHTDVGETFCWQKVGDKILLTCIIGNQSVLNDRQWDEWTRKGKKNTRHVPTCHCRYITKSLIQTRTYWVIQLDTPESKCWQTPGRLSSSKGIVQGALGLCILKLQSDGTTWEKKVTVLAQFVP